MEKTVKNKHVSKWKLICTESKNCCKSVLFRPKFGLESHGLRCIWYPPNKNLPLCMFYWYLHLWFDYVIKKTKKPRENQKTQRKTIFQDSCKSKNPKIKQTSRKPKKTKKQYSRTLAKVKMQKSKKPRENQKKQKKAIFQKFGDGGLQTRVLEYCFFFVFFGFLEFFFDFCIFSFSKSPGILFFLFFFVFSRFFWFLHFSFSKSPGILFFLGFLFFLVFSRFFGLDFSWWRCTIY